MGYKKEAYNIEKKDYELTDGQRLKSYVAHSPKLPNWNKTHGGPIYMGVGEHMIINTTQFNFTVTEEGTKTNLTYVNQTIYQYSTSFVEFFYYQ